MASDGRLVVLGLGEDWCARLGEKTIFPDGASWDSICWVICTAFWLKRRLTKVGLGLGYWWWVWGCGVRGISRCGESGGVGRGWSMCGQGNFVAGRSG